MTSLDVDNLALRKITVYNSDNTFVSTNRVFTVGNNGNVNWSDSLSLSSLVASSILTSSITASTIAVSTIAVSTITTTNLLVNGSTMIGPQGIAMYSSDTSSFTDNLTTQGQYLFFNGQRVQTGDISGVSYWDDVSGKGWIYNTNIGENDGDYYLVGIGTNDLTATLDVSGSIRARSTIQTNTISPDSLLTITNNTVIQKVATDVNFEISNTNTNTNICQVDQPITASLTLRTMNGAYTLWNSKCDGQGLTQNNLTLYSYFGTPTPIIDIDPSGNIEMFNDIRIRGAIRLISADTDEIATIQEANFGHLDISSALVRFTTEAGVQITPINQDTGSGTLTLFNGESSDNPVYYILYASGDSSGGLTVGHLQLYSYSGIGYDTDHMCLDIDPSGNNIIMGENDISGGFVVNINGKNGLGRVYDTVYNPPPSALSTYWDISDNNIYNTNSGNVGINTSTPSYDLDISGSARVSDIIDSDIYDSSGIYTVPIPNNATFIDFEIIGSGGAGSNGGTGGYMKGSVNVNEFRGDTLTIQVGTSGINTSYISILSSQLFVIAGAGGGTGSNSGTSIAGAGGGGIFVSGISNGTTASGIPSEVGNGGTTIGGIGGTGPSNGQNGNNPSGFTDVSGGNRGISLDSFGGRGGNGYAGGGGGSAGNGGGAGGGGGSSYYNTTYVSIFSSYRGDQLPTTVLSSYGRADQNGYVSIKIYGSGQLIADNIVCGSIKTYPENVQITPVPPSSTLGNLKPVMIDTSNNIVVPQNPLIHFFTMDISSNTTIIKNQNNDTYSSNDWVCSIGGYLSDSNTIQSIYTYINTSSTTWGIGCNYTGGNTITVSVMAISVQLTAYVQPIELA